MSEFTYVLISVFSLESKSMNRFAVECKIDNLPGGFDALQYWGDHAEMWLTVIPEHWQEIDNVLVRVEQIQGIKTEHA